MCSRDEIRGRRWHGRRRLRSASTGTATTAARVARAGWALRRRARTALTRVVGRVAPVWVCGGGATTAPSVRAASEQQQEQQHGQRQRREAGAARTRHPKTARVVTLQRRLRDAAARPAPGKQPSA